ncbi:MAG: response regulator [Desulfobacula sp.]|nr:response regulator [Desulfobacula sp.]
MKILVVDDKATNRKTLEIYAKKLGHKVITATDGQEGWKIWDNERPRMVVTDWVMPNMNGLELCSAIRENDDEDYTYIVMVTAQDEISEVIQGMKAGADDYLIKPVNKEEFYFRLKAGERILNLQDKDIVIFSLAKLAESRDPETGSHLERIRFFSKTLAQTLLEAPSAPLELNYRYIDNIFLTSPLHDIGKVGIPDQILLKPGRLNNNEFDVIKTHTLIGFETLNEALQKSPKAEYLRMSAEIALFHHEKFDGSGYPNALSSDSIPLSARIVALADVYDALTSKRVYKEAMDHGKAYDIILNEKGAHFDPMVVNAFEKCVNEFLAIKKRFEEK